MTNKNDEIILVTPVKKVFDGLPYESFEGSKSIKDPDTGIIMDNIANNYTTMRRGDAEVEINVKQPIPYAVVAVGSKVFQYTRLVKAGEQKLHGKSSIGLGGHMNNVPEATTFDEVLVQNLVRELEEETEILDADGNVITDIESHITLKKVGVLNNEDEVGQYHICILYRVQLPLGYDVRINPKEADQLEGGLVTLEELRKNYDNLEAWSQITADLL